MAEPDYSLASKIAVPPAQNPLEMMKGIQNYRLLKSEADQKQIDVNSLAEYKNTRDARSLEGASPELRSSTLSGDKTEMEIKKDTMARDAAFIANEPDPQIKKYLWQRKGEEYKRKGWVAPDVWDKHKDNPNDQILENLQRGNTSVPEWRQTTGETSGAEAAARAPYEGREVDPTKPFEYPAVRPGGPLAGRSPVGHTITAPGAQPSFSPTGGAPDVRPPGTVNLTDTNATVMPPATGKPGTPSAAPGKNVVAMDKTNPYSGEVPEIPVGHDMPTGKGIVQPGYDPLRAAARAEGQKKFNEDIEPAATSAAKTRASLGTMKASLDKGVTTDRLAELKTTIGGFLYGVTKDPQFVKGATGLDVANQEVFNKESTRMGLTFARQTEGAREAVQAIRIALGANPSLLNTEQGNRQIIGIMDQSSKYDQERAKAAQAFMQKNDGHLTGFDTWFNQSHPPASFISKAVPYQVPQGGKSEMQNGVTYEFNYGGKKVRGTYNAETGHMDPVAQ